MSQDKYDRLHELAFSHCEDSLQEEEVQELEQLLSSDQEALQEYLKCMKLNVRLRRLLRGLGDDVDFSEVDVKQLVGMSAATPPGDSQVAPRKGWGGFGLTLLALAACLLLFFNFRSQSPNNVVDVDTSFIARVVNKVDCDWESERWGTSQSEDLEVGQVLNLNRGLMQLEFESGALVTLEGPAQFEIESTMRGFLHSGRLTAKVPKRARGFTVGSPACDSVDLGTEFGLFVADDGTAETHVFEGEVILKKTGSEASQQDAELRLTTAEASKVDGNTEEFSDIAAAPKQFTRIDFSDGVSALDQAVSSALPEDRQLALWFDAARNVQTDEKNRVVSWSDLVFADNEAQENAWQVEPWKRPWLTEQGLNGQPSIRFKGKRHLVTAPLQTGDDVTVFVAFQARPHNLVEGRTAMLINFNGPPNLVLSRTQSNELIGRMYAGYEDGETIHGTWLESQPEIIREMEPLVAAVVYGATTNRSELYANGALLAAGEANEPAAIYSPKFIGCHRNGSRDFFDGDIAEILVFNSALTKEECAKISSALMDKYGIVADSVGAE